MANVRVALQTLNSVQFADGEWQRFVSDWLDHKPSRHRGQDKVHDDYVLDFVFDDGGIRTLPVRQSIARNKVQVIKQFEQKGNPHQPL